MLRLEGIDVARTLGEYAGLDLDGEPVALMIDDAEHLSDEDVAELTNVMRGGGLHVVVAFRSWPRSAAVADLVDRLGRRRPHLVLRYLSGSGVESGRRAPGRHAAR